MFPQEEITGETPYYAYQLYFADPAPTKKTKQTPSAARRTAVGLLGSISVKGKVNGLLNFEDFLDRTDVDVG